MLFDVPPSPTYWEEEGTLVFADVSGFTRLSERLARLGRIGAEELVTTISRVFTRLLSATDDGGDVLKFGGDALLIFYRGPDHALRAAHASLGMQRALQEVGRIVGAHGRVRLRMSVGVHTGLFPFLLIGEEHLELVVTGPEATRTVELESDATAGEILLSAETAERLPPGSVRTGAGGRLRLRAVPEPLSLPDGSTSAGPSVDLTRYIPIRLRGRLGPETAEHEHRQVTVSFVHFAGVDELVRGPGVGVAFERLRALARTVETVTSDLDVTIITTDIGPDGGKYYLAAGTPDAMHDDEGRMLHACRRIVDADVGLLLRAGVNRGHVFGGDVGAPFRRTYSVMGDTVNLAARIMGKASFGSVLAHRSVMENARSTFGSTPVPPFTVKGKSQPVHAALVGPPAPEGPDAPLPPELPLIGRAREFADLSRAATAAGAGQGSVVEVVGEAGLGKSRLVREVVRTAGGLRTIEVSCDPIDRNSPYYASRILLRKVLGIPLDTSDTRAGGLLRERLRDHSPSLQPWAPLLGQAVGADLPPTQQVRDVAPRFRSARLREAVTELLRTTLGPALIVVEDAAWMDDASADALVGLATIAAEMPWLVLLTRRDEVSGLHPGLGFPARTLRMGALAEDDAAALAAAATQASPLPPSALEEMTRRAGGNPLFLIELLGSPMTDGQLPSSIESVLAARIDALRPEDRAALRFVSVLGARTSSRVLDRAFGDLGISSADADLWRRLAGFLEHDGRTVRFRHDLIRQTAYEGLTYRRRRDLHARAARTYQHLADEDASDHDALLALHFHKAGLYEEALPHAVGAANRARDTYSNVLAARFLERALDAAERIGRPSSEVGDLAEQLGDVLEAAGRYEVADAAYRKARSRAEGIEVLGLLRKQGRLRERQGALSAALRWYGRALNALDDVQDERTRTALRGQLRTAYAVVRYRQGRFRAAADLCARARMDAEEAGDRETLAYASYVLDASRNQLDPSIEGENYRLALRIYEELGDLLGQANVLDNLGVQAFYGGDWDRARSFYEQSREAAERVGDTVGAAVSAMNIGEILCDQGHLREAEELLLGARLALRGANYGVGAALCDAYLARTALRSGHPEIALEAFEVAIGELSELGADAFALETRIRAVGALLELDRPGGALTEVRACLAHLGAEHGPSLVAMARRFEGQALAALGRTPEAESALDHSLQVARDAGVPFEVAVTLELRADLGFGDARGQRVEAGRLLERLGVVRVERYHGAELVRSS